MIEEQSACHVGRARASSSFLAGHGLAPRWHTASLVLLIASVAALGTLLAQSGSVGVARGTGAPSPAVSLLSLLFVQLALLFYVAKAFRASSVLHDLVGRGWDSPSRAAGDLALAALAFAAIVALELGWAAWQGSTRDPSVEALLPRTSMQRAAWVIVAACVGFCEEVVYRGYLQKQLAAFGGHALVGIAVSAVLFGVAHLQQGPGPALRIGAYGLLLGMIAWRRRSLVPGIVCHVALDVVAGLAVTIPAR